MDFELIFTRNKGKSEARRHTFSVHEIRDKPQPLSLSLSLFKGRPEIEAVSSTIAEQHSPHATQG